jgi:peptide/nickel transport system ATP-binding protein
MSQASNGPDSAHSMPAGPGVFSIEHLTVSYRGSMRPTTVVQDVSLSLYAGEILGLAGESGCGKSTTALASTGYPIPGMAARRGAAVLSGTNLLNLPAGELRQMWGRDIAYLPQDASTSLTPNARIGRLFRETLGAHAGLSRKQARSRSLEMLSAVGLVDDAEMLRRYPFEFSGGQQQRLALAMAFVCEPKVLILDEPTTGLDVTTQDRISKLVKQLAAESHTAVMYVSHDLRLLRHLCTRIAVMYAGEIVEIATAEDLWTSPKHPYTAALLESVPNVNVDHAVVAIPGVPPPHVVPDRCAFEPRCGFAIAACTADSVALEVDADRSVRCLRAADLRLAGGLSLRPKQQAPTSAESPLLELSSLTCRYPGRIRAPAVEGLSIAVREGEILGIVGESGAGKSTLLRAIIGLHAAEAGSMTYMGKSVPFSIRGRSQAVLQGIQIVFQNPASSLNPRQSVRSLVRRPIQKFEPGLKPAEYEARVVGLLESVQLDSSFLHRYPSELSGGQQQRVALARALAPNPRLVLCDEVVSSLDVSVQAAIIELIQQLRAQRGVAIMFVTHDLGVVRTLVDRVAVMHAGKIVEIADTTTLFSTPNDTYTSELLEAARLTGDAEMDHLGGPVPTSAHRASISESRPADPYPKNGMRL